MQNLPEVCTPADAPVVDTTPLIAIPTVMIAIALIALHGFKLDITGTALCCSINLAVCACWWLSEFALCCGRLEAGVVARQPGRSLEIAVSDEKTQVYQRKY